MAVKEAEEVAKKYGGKAIWVRCAPDESDEIRIWKADGEKRYCRRTKVIGFHRNFNFLAISRSSKAGFPTSWPVKDQVSCNNLVLTVPHGTIISDYGSYTDLSECEFSSLEEIDKREWPHVCPNQSCKAPAVQLFTSTICSVGGERCGVSR